MKLQWNMTGMPAKQQSPEPSSDDIKGLFRQFDAEPGQYREIVKDVRALESEARWPLLSTLNIAPAAPAAPPVIASGGPATASAPGSLAAVFQRLVKAPAAAPPLPRFKIS